MEVAKTKALTKSVYEGDQNQNPHWMLDIWWRKNAPVAIHLNHLGNFSRGEDSLLLLYLLFVPPIETLCLNQVLLQW